MFYLILLSNFIQIAILSILVKIFYILTKKQEQQEKTQKTFQRIHPKIQKNDDNAFGGKKAYDLYKNENGLYEPIKKPSRGIELKEGGIAIGRKLL